MKKYRIQILGIAVLSAGLLAMLYWHFSSGDVVQQILATNPKQEIPDQVYDDLADLMVTPNKISDNELEQLTLCSFQRIAQNDPWLISLITTAYQSDSIRTATIRSLAINYINDHHDKDGDVLSFIDSTQSPVKPTELNLQTLFADANESLLISIYIALHDETIDNGQSYLAILQDRADISAKTISRFEEWTDEEK